MKGGEALEGEALPSMQSAVVEVMLFIMVPARQFVSKEFKNSRQGMHFSRTTLKREFLFAWPILALAGGGSPHAFTTHLDCDYL